MNQPATENTPDNPELRLFIGIACPLLSKVENLMKELHSAALEPGAGIKLVATRNLHVTLKFLGSVEASLIRDIANLLDQVAADTSPFDIRLSGIGIFKDAFWLGVTPCEALTALAATIDQQIEPYGFTRRTGPYVPHLTVARLNKKSLADFQSRVRTSNSERWGNLHVQEIHLYQSRTLPEGAQYSIVHTSKFKPLA
ncbi:MAG: RNA 2',3'-cyclic phosphodiesterase [Pseudomonadota bacterium]